jgi:hypothetical protein
MASALQQMNKLPEALDQQIYALDMFAKVCVLVIIFYLLILFFWGGGGGGWTLVLTTLGFAGNRVRESANKVRPRKRGAPAVGREQLGEIYPTLRV